LLVARPFGTLFLKDCGVMLRDLRCEECESESIGA
jgi:hypothetical protein